VIALAASQTDLALRAGAALVRLFRLVTYTDRDEETVEAEHFFAMGAPVRYGWDGGADQDFADVVLACSEIEVASDHLPDPKSSSLRRSRVALRLANDSVDGAVLWQTLSSRNLAFARLEIATLAIEPTRFAVGTAFWDLTDLPGTEHVVRFRGELTGIEDAGDEGVNLQFEGEEPTVLWPELENATDADPRDLGRRYSIPFGRAKAIPCVNRKVGWATTLSDVISSQQTGNVKVTSTAGLPSSGSFTLSIDAERVTATTVDATTINISARAQSSTTATAHQRGAPVLEILSSMVVVVAGAPCVAVDALYVVNPATRERVLVPSSLYTTNLDDRTTDPGRRLTTVTFSSANLETLLDSLAATGSEPAYDEVELNKFTIELPGGTGYCDVQLNTDGLGLRVQGTSGGSTFEKALWQMDAAAIPTALLGRGIVRARIKVLYNGEGDTTTDGAGNSVTDLKGEARFKTWGSSGSNVNESLDYRFDNGSQESGVAVASNWVTPVAAKAGADLVDLEARFWLDAPNSPAVGYGSDNWAFVFAGAVVAEVEFEPSRTGSLGASAFGFGLDFSADVQGVFVPYEFAAGYGFDEGSSWSVGNRTTQSDQGGVQRVEASVGLIADAAGACDDSTLWVATNATLSNETTLKTQGTAALKVDTISGGSLAQAQRTWVTGEDWSGCYLAIDIYVENAGHISTAQGIRVRVQSSPGNNKRWDLGTADGLVEGAYRTTLIDLESAADSTNGTLDLTSVTDLILTANGRTNSAANVAYFDNIRLIPKLAIAQRNATAASVDLSATGTRYRTRLKATNVSVISSVTVRFSNTAGTGTTLPAAYRSVTIPGAELAEGQWLEVEQIGSDTGSPGVNNVETVRLEIAHNGSADLEPTVDFDVIGGATATAAVGWDGATPGALLELGPDAIRYFVGVLAGLGAENVQGVATAKTNLGGVAFAGTFNALGSSFADVVARLAFETRTNVARREASSGTVFDLSNATTAGAFPASSRTLSEILSLRESARPALATPSRFRAHYAIDLGDGDALGADERAFRGLLVADSSASDVAATTTQLAAIEAKVGARAADPLFLAFSQAKATAADVFGYYVAESIRTPARRWRARVPLSEGYDLSPFDVVAFTPRWSSAVKARVLATRFDMGRASIELELAEVL
jgi:hypothetical protein